MQLLCDWRSKTFIQPEEFRHLDGDRCKNLLLFCPANRFVGGINENIDHSAHPIHKKV
jgi:hypothetical protein